MLVLLREIAVSRAGSVVSREPVKVTLGVGEAAKALRTTPYEGGRGAAALRSCMLRV
jgi:hypothetical protein